MISLTFSTAPELCVCARCVYVHVAIFIINSIKYYCVWIVKIRACLLGLYNLVFADVSKSPRKVMYQFI